MKRVFLVLGTAIMTAILALSLLGLTVRFASASINSPDTETSSAYPKWQLIVTGFVNNSLNLNMTELVALPKSSVYAECYCVGLPEVMIVAGNWTGVKLRLILEKAGISPEAVKVGFHAPDGFSTDLTIQTAMGEDIILAYELNGEPLEEVVRLVVPEKWGYKWIKGVEWIEVFNYNFLGTYESMGYSDEADTGVPPPKGSPIPPDLIPPRGGEIPEFPSILSFVIAVILITLVAAMVKRRFRKP